MTRRAFVIREKKVVCFWSPKAGNSSLGHWLVRGLWADEHDRSGLPFREFLRGTGRVVDFGRAADLVSRERFDSFALVRDPYQRATSAYMNKFLYNGSAPLDRFDRLEGFSRRFIVDCADGEAGEAYRGISFVQFLQAVISRVRAPGASGEPELNIHWNTQTPFHFRDIGFRYGRIIHLETVEADIVPLADRLGIGTPFPHMRHRRNAAGPNRVDLSEAPSLEILRRGLVPSDEDLLSAGARQLIGEAYAVDFTTLGYSKRPA